jgi:hypothetical protein
VACLFRSPVTRVSDQLLQKMGSAGGMKVLAKPDLITTLGRPANMLSGGEFPIMIPVGAKKVAIEWREFGTRCQVVALPTAEPGKLKIKIQMSISERDFKNAVTIAGLTVPGLTTRRVNSEATLRYGETLVISMFATHPQKSVGLSASMRVPQSVNGMLAIHPQESEPGEANAAESKTITVYLVTPSVPEAPKRHTSGGRPTTAKPSVGVQ